MSDIVFDHQAPDFGKKNYELYRNMRANCPVAHSAAHGGFWVLAQYEDVFRVARDDKTFSSAREVVIPATEVGRLIPLQSDPPELERYRGLLGPFFTPSTVKNLEPFILDVIDRSIGAFAERGSADVVAELANPVPSSVTMKLLGLDPAEWRIFAEPIHAAGYSVHGSQENVQARAAVNALTIKIENEIDARRRRPRDDMISKLLASDYQGRKTTREETIELVRMVIFGGMDTVMAALSNIFVTFGRHPDVRDRLQADRSLLPQKAGVMASPGALAAIVL